ncbi:hypothetical protein SDC9_103921 [bioreactor metagenome]|uniref:Uncharacterized protein n=1 Tax=bioreactor metagenome TaxID=1076179 RepID=A0A645B1Q9_9ZZZZ
MFSEIIPTKIPQKALDDLGIFLCAIPDNIPAIALDIKHGTDVIPPGLIKYLCAPAISPAGILTTGPNNTPPDTMEIILVFTIDPL